MISSASKKPSVKNVPVTNEAVNQNHADDCMSVSDVLQMNRFLFQKTIHGQCTDFFALTNKDGVFATFTNYGARLVSLYVPDRNGVFTNVVLGYEDIDAYIHSSEPLYGAVIAAPAEGLTCDSFCEEEQRNDLSNGNGIHHLNYSNSVFHQVVWKGRYTGDSSVEFMHSFQEGEDGCGGKLIVKVVYTLTDANELLMDFEVWTDTKARMYLTHHHFFNLNGEGSGTIHDHLLYINSVHYQRVNSQFIPTDTPVPVKGTPFDFRCVKTMGRDIHESHPQLELMKGYDHHYLLDSTGWKMAAFAEGKQSGIVMEVWTTEPGLQFYSGNFMKGNNKLRQGMDDVRTAFCLRTYYDAGHWSAANLCTPFRNQGERHHSQTMYKFLVTGVIR